MQKAVVLKNITKRFPGIVANDRIDLEIQKGEIHAIVGENGAGKSTLMKVLAGLYQPDEGEIYIFGKKEKISSPNKAIELKIGMVHQHLSLIHICLTFPGDCFPVYLQTWAFPKIHLDTFTGKLVKY